MKLAVATVFLIETCFGKNEASKKIQQKSFQNKTARNVLEYNIERLDHQDHTSSVIGDNATKVQSTTLRPTIEIGSVDGSSLPNTTLKNAPTSHFESQDRLRECLPSLKTSRTADVGILGCGWEQYCMESTKSTLGGVCVAIDTIDTMSMPNVNPEDANPEGEPKKRLLLDRTPRLQQVFSFMNQRASGRTECRPSHEDDGTCKANQRCISDVFSSMGGFCLDNDFSSLGDHDTFSGLRNLQSGYPYTIFYDFIGYGCNNNIDLMTCECTSNTYGGTVLSCQYDKLCESRETPCFGYDTILQYCSRLTIEAQATSVNNFDFKLCHQYLSPVEMIYCYQVVTQNGLIACSMTMNDEECQSCDLDPQNVCIDFDCSNTPMGRFGNLCSDQPLGDLALLELLDCSGACNICGEGNKLLHYGYDLSPIAAPLFDCYSPTLCTPEALTCEDLQKVALAAWPMGSDGFCRIAPDVDVSPQCCLTTSTDNPLPPPTELPSVICEDLHHDCFGCIETDDCFWCPGDALCSSMPFLVDDVNLFDREQACNSEDEFETDTCIDPDNFFSDPLYSSQEWIFEIIKLKEVWLKGYTGKGIRVRINDEGIDMTHPEFYGRLDVESSCLGQVIPPPSVYDKGFSHGTSVASIVGAGADNDVCGVGIAPNVTLSSCFFNTMQTLADLYTYKLDSFDISQNSWGREACPDRNGTTVRRLQQSNQCPFTYRESPAYPCLYCDFGSNHQVGDCIKAIEIHCGLFFREDSIGCLEHLELVLGGNCDFQNLSEENEAAFTKGVQAGRGGKGVIYIFASGNSLSLGSDTNFEGLGTNTRMAMTVGAVGKNGLIATYSTPGSSVFVSAPGGDTLNSMSNIVTAALNGGCTDSGQGTSFAAPVVSGVVALMLEANSELTYRDVQSIIATTSQPVLDEVDHTAGYNAASPPLFHSNAYGFGIVNAKAAVEAAESWESIPAEDSASVQSGLLNIQIPDDVNKPVVDSFQVDVSSPATLESVYLYLRIEHSSRGHLQVMLTSPSGTESILAPGRRPENSQQPKSQWWRLMTLKFWGETPNGQWTISVVDLKDGDADLNGSCGDFEWVYLDRITCFVLESVQYCENGKVDPFGYAQSKGEKTPIFSHLHGGVTAADACCACGGGVDVNTLSDTLAEWKLVLFGPESYKDDPIEPNLTIVPTGSPSLHPGTPSSYPTNAPSDPFASDPPTLSNSEQLQADSFEIVANGDIYFLRGTLPMKQPSPTAETMLVRKGDDEVPGAFSLISFPYRYRPIVFGNFESRFDVNTEIRSELCLHHVQNGDASNSSTYTICRVRPESLHVTDGDPHNLETYKGSQLGALVMPSDCMGNESHLIPFDVSSNDTFICNDVSDLLLLSLHSRMLGPQQDVPSVLRTPEDGKDIVMFMLDDLGPDSGKGNQFYTVNSQRPPQLVFHSLAKDPNTQPVTTSPPAVSTNPTADITMTEPPVESPSQAPSLNNTTQSPSALATRDSTITKRFLWGLIGLMLLCPLLLVCLGRMPKKNAASKDINGDHALVTATINSGPSLPMEQAPTDNFEGSHSVPSSSIFYPSPPFPTDVEIPHHRQSLVSGAISTGAASLEGNSIRFPLVKSDENERGSSYDDQTDGRWESKRSHISHTENFDDELSSS